MSKNKTKAVLNVLQMIRKEGGGSVTYRFGDDTVQTQPINPDVFIDPRSDAYTPMTEIIKIFNTTMHDLCAVDYTINK